MGYKWANTLFGCLATIMVPIPFVHFFFFLKLKKMSSVVVFPVTDLKSFLFPFLLGSFLYTHSLYAVCQVYSKILDANHLQLELILDG